MSSVESEQRMVRRDCIIDIIKIMEVSSPTEKREHVKKIKKELEIKSVSTAPSVIMKQLTRMLKSLEREIRMANCFGKASTKSGKEEKKMDTHTAKRSPKSFWMKNTGKRRKKEQNKGQKRQKEDSNRKLRER